MKKLFLLVPVAALVMTACTSESTESVGAAQQPKEISFTALAQPNTRAAVEGTTFTPTTMTVAAYDATNDREFFDATTFTKDGAVWKGGKYWPFTATDVNFMAYSELQNAATPVLTWDATATTSTWVLVMTDNKTAQKDLMYAKGFGQVTQPSGNTLSFNSDAPVTMEFKHAQALIKFNADAYDATSDGKVTLNSITLNGAKYNGTYTITFTNNKESSSQGITGAWSALGSTADVTVPGWDTPTAIAYDSSGNGQSVGDGLMIVPDDNDETADWTSFTINYVLDGLNYTYTYAPTSRNVQQGKMYTYNIVFKLHEIEISATATDWVENADGNGAAQEITIQ